MCLPKLITDLVSSFSSFSLPSLFLPLPPISLPPSSQVMVNSEVSGVAFSRHPLNPLSKEATLVEAVFGLGEGLVSGALDADRYEVRQERSMLIAA